MRCCCASDLPSLPVLALPLSWLGRWDPRAPFEPLGQRSAVEAHAHSAALHPTLHNAHNTGRITFNYCCKIGKHALVTRADIEMAMMLVTLSWGQSWVQGDIMQRGLVGSHA